MLPIDSIFPLLDVLAIGAPETDDQRRADLLLAQVEVSDEEGVSVNFIPIEIKMRSQEAVSFPSTDSKAVQDPMEQLSATSTVLDCVVENYKSSGSDLGLVNSALGTLIEAGLALRSPESNSSGVSEVGVLEAVACGSIRLSCSRGALSWFQVGARGVGQGMYERRDFEGDQPASSL